MSMMKQLTEMQLDSICGGNNITFNPTPGATACGGGQSGGSLCHAQGGDLLIG